MAAYPFWCGDVAVARTAPYQCGQVGQLSSVGPGEGSNKPQAGPELLFSASILMQRELPIS